MADQTRPVASGVGDYARAVWRCGNHSGIPMCCIRFYVETWLGWVYNDPERHAAELERRRGRAQYIQCPACLESGARPARLRPCPDPKFCTAAARNESLERATCAPPPEVVEAAVGIGRLDEMRRALEAREESGDECASEGLADLDAKLWTLAPVVAGWARGRR